MPNKAAMIAQARVVDLLALITPTTKTNRAGMMAIRNTMAFESLIEKVVGEADSYVPIHHIPHPSRIPHHHIPRPGAEPAMLVDRLHPLRQRGSLGLVLR